MSDRGVNTIALSVNTIALKKVSPELTVAITCAWELKYFKNGRANMHVARTYRVDQYDSREGAMHQNTAQFKTKAEAQKHFRYLVKAAV